MKARDQWYLKELQKLLAEADADLDCHQHQRTKSPGNIRGAMVRAWMMLLKRLKNLRINGRR